MKKPKSIKRLKAFDRLDKIVQAVKLKNRGKGKLIELGLKKLRGNKSNVAT